MSKLKRMSTGASIGAVVGGSFGTIVPGLGNAIGASVGCLLGVSIGLIASKSNRAKLSKFFKHSEGSFVRNDSRNYLGNDDYLLYEAEQHSDELSSRVREDEGLLLTEKVETKVNQSQNMCSTNTASFFNKSVNSKTDSNNNNLKLTRITLV